MFSSGHQDTLGVLHILSIDTAPPMHRNDLLSKGIELLDTREGTTYRIIGE